MPNSRTSSRSTCSVHTRLVHVAVLLSTYNGERWLPAQLDSLLAQTHQDLRVVVRDDGSADGTRRVLRNYAARHPLVQWSSGANLGPAASFLALLANATSDADLVAFCDQDDVWEPDHLERAVAALAAAQPGPAMWCSDVLVCDEELTPLRRHDVVRLQPSFENALVENVATGCTIVLNRAAVELLAAAQPRSPVMHDAWCYLVVGALGRVVYDPRPSVRYRLHTGNAMGLSSGRVATQVARGRRAWSGPHVGAWSRQAEDLRQRYGQLLPPEVSREVDAFLAGRDGAAARLRYALTGRARRQTAVGTVGMRLLYLLGRI
jgi:glycosyltransferase involved in cell wall biosynthesis